MATWKDIPSSNERSDTFPGVNVDTDTLEKKLEINNIFVIARRQVDVGGLTQVRLHPLLITLILTLINKSSKFLINFEV